MDIKAKVEEVVDKVKNNPEFASEFQANPVAAVEKILGVDLPDDVIKNIADTVKSKISVDGIKDKLGGLGNLFGGK